ncbi:MAG: HypC/HybG/HupF family hydrogenase formation chaperone [Candidatus Sulfopaludibacter sp.]|nr:HypC/HybG/HupF family hydrogenase formation chaperone [Candidatus Sulfopaludibacter sp.]
MCLAIPGKILSLADDATHSAMIEVVGVRRRVDVSLVAPEGIGPGDWVLIHVGFALSKIREEDAIEQLRMLSALGETQAAMEEVRGYSHDEVDPPPGERAFP